MNGRKLSQKNRQNGGMICSQHGLPILGMHSLWPTDRFPQVNTKKHETIKGLAAIPMCRECKL